MHAFLISHATTILAAIASFVMLNELGGSKRTSQSTLAWLLALVFIPFVALPLFLIVGRRKFPARAKRPDEDSRRRAAAEWTEEDARSIAGVLRSGGVAPPRPGSTFELLTTGEAAYARLMDLIARAEQTIDLTVFILADDATGRAVVDALAARAASGVDVRVILDAVGSSRMRRHAAATLGKVGASVRAFMPLVHSPIRGRTNLRSHRKLAIFDGWHVLAGGMNLADEYMARPHRPADGAMSRRWCVDLSQPTPRPCSSRIGGIVEALIARRRVGKGRRREAQARTECRSCRAAPISSPIRSTISSFRASSGRASASRS